jgi:uncharacterized protein (TIGR03089 family)
MTGAGVPTPYELLGDYADRTQPWVTHYAGADARVELSVASTANAVAKAAGLLRDSLGLGPGSTFSVDLPRHWQLPVWVMAGLSVGATCGRSLPGHVDVRIRGPHDLAADPAADEVLACSCDAFGMPVPGGVPAGVVDVALEVRAHPDLIHVEPGIAGTAVIILRDGPLPWAAALGAADPATTGLARGARLWVGDRTAEADLLVQTVVMPLAVRGSLVIATGLSPALAAEIQVREGVTPPAR